MDIWLEERPQSPDSEGNIELEHTSLFIRAVGQHRSRDIWVTVGTEAGHTTLVEAINKWLPILSDRLLYSHKTYPVIVHGIPTTFDMLRDGADVCKHLVDYNLDIFAHPSTLLSVKFLGGKCNRTSQKTRGSLILYIADPTTATHALTAASPSRVAFCPPPNSCAACHDA